MSVTVIMIEDDPARVALAKRLLPRFAVGAELIAFNRAEPALTILKNCAMKGYKIAMPDLVLCDVHLPGMSGYDMARSIGTNPLLAGRFPVALYTYSPTLDHAERAFASGASAVLNKHDMAQLLHDGLNLINANARKHVSV